MNRPTNSAMDIASGPAHADLVDEIMTDLAAIVKLWSWRDSAVGFPCLRHLCLFRQRKPKWLRLRALTGSSEKAELDAARQRAPERIRARRLADQHRGQPGVEIDVPGVK